ncbi:MAG: cell filamentation protein Fic [Candidatus Magasanikbacteria bacterium CG_4_10_14_0_2_um_filter_41_10]|uniref:Cell filamentation protein Fic n=1 Tax=Candidatus Magasanikbacteria bacterium CG_4_10_14_0_2_um_filter_41_10 TaxID=1974638 RepID=A0A2M7V5H3_9BACT|nr:MAG: cell filamentation protein Fic [Candidatus Magasanikbacteria bacterium CG_4_10_14_0_2_um_filter_41_10]
MSDESLQFSQFLLYNSPEGGVNMEVYIYDETVWLSQKMMAELFGVDIRTISEHLQNIFKLAELSEKTVIRNFRTTASDGKTYEVNFYNLDAIISVGYRVNSKQATHFRRWATSVLRDYIIKGFAMDDELLKNGTRLGKDYFKELLERIRSIRASERRMYQQITDLFAECSIDYDKDADITHDFYAMVQNKFHFAITGKTAAEKIYESVNRDAPYMGLKTWKKSPDGRVVKTDTSVAKNYLDEDEIKSLERVVTGYFDYIERLVENQTVLDMQGLSESINKFLEFNEYRVLDDKGKVSMDMAKKKAGLEYDAFNKTQRIESDFDKVVKKLKE